MSIVSRLNIHVPEFGLSLGRLRLPQRGNLQVEFPDVKGWLFGILGIVVSFCQWWYTNWPFILTMNGTVWGTVSCRYPCFYVQPAFRLKGRTYVVGAIALELTDLLKLTLSMVGMVAYGIAPYVNRQQSLSFDYMLVGIAITLGFIVLAVFDRATSRIEIPMYVISIMGTLAEMRGSLVFEDGTHTLMNFAYTQGWQVLLPCVAVFVYLFLIEPILRVTGHLQPISVRRPTVLQSVVTDSVSGVGMTPDFVEDEEDDGDYDDEDEDEETDSEGNDE